MTMLSASKLLMLVPCAITLMTLTAAPAAAQTVPSQPLYRQVDADDTGVHRDAKPKEWDITLGFGAGASPEYPGSDKMEFTPVPVVNIVYRNRLFLGPEGLGAYAVRNEWLTLGGSLAFRGGRDEDDSDNLRGMGDISLAFQTRLFGKVNFYGPLYVGARMSRDFGGSDGLTTDLDLGASYKVTDKLRLSGGITTAFGDDNYMQKWFGVSAEQSQRSGKPLYDAPGGFYSVGGFFSANYQFDENWGVMGNANLGYLISDAQASPLTVEKFQPKFILAGTYRF